jgi:MbtH protein
MAQEDQEDTRVYVVVVNHEEQYSVWPDGEALPNGWRAAGRSGTRAECLAWVQEVWTDMTPASLRAARSRPPTAP